MYDVMTWVMRYGFVIITWLFRLIQTELNAVA